MYNLPKQSPILPHADVQPANHDTASRSIVLCSQKMPPRKSDVSKAVTGDEGLQVTPAKEPSVREGINVEVRCLCSLCACNNTSPLPSVT
jgi:hypothetical protein